MSENRNITDLKYIFSEKDCIMIKKNKNHYKKEKFILYLSKLFILLVFSGSLYFMWTEYYNPYIPKPFYQYGNYLLLALFMGIYFAFVKVYGGFMVGTAQVHDLIFSQIIAIGFLQGISYIIFDPYVVLY